MKVHAETITEIRTCLLESAPDLVVLNITTTESTHHFIIPRASLAAFGKQMIADATILSPDPSTKTPS